MAGSERSSVLEYAMKLKILVCLSLITLVASLVPAAQAQTFSVIHTFSTGADGFNPLGGLTLDKTGKFYGTTWHGGAGNGTVFELTHSGSGWVLTRLYAFAGGDDGSYLYNKLTVSDGSFYGTTNAGGGDGCDGPGCGTIFNLRPSATACKTALCPVDGDRALSLHRRR